MIGTIRKHSTWMWIIIIAVIIITFVFWGASPDRYGSGGKVNLGAINGEPITRDDYFNTQREVLLRYFFSYGEFPGAQAKQANFDLERETYFRLILLRKMKQLGIHVGMDAVLKTRDNLLTMMGRGNPMPLDMFTSQVLSRERLTAEDFRRFIQNDLGIQQLISVAGVGGRLVTPQEARELYERENAQLATEAVFFSGSNHMAGVSTPPEAVQQFYSNQMARFRLPERVQVKYVEYPVTNYLAEAQKIVTNINEVVEARFREIGTNYLQIAKSPEEAKEKIREATFKNVALNLAAKEASSFASRLFDLEPMRAENIELFARTNDTVVKVSEPFDQFGPGKLRVAQDFAKRAFALSAEEPFAGPLKGEDAVYVIAMDKRLPSEIPPLDKIRDQVVTEYKFDQGVRAAIKAGEAFATALTNGPAKGKKFEEVAQEMGARAVSVPPFSMTTQSVPEVEAHVPLNDFKEAVFQMRPGQASGFIRTRDGGFVVSLRQKLPLEVATMNAEMPAFLNSVRQARQSDAFNSWFSKEVERGVRDIPFFKQQQQQQQGGAPRT